jgi:hypothetical protein
MNNENEQFHFFNFDLIFYCFVYQRILTKKKDILKLRKKQNATKT